MVVVVNDSALGDVRELSDFELDLAFGSDENALSLECDAAYAPEEGQFVFIDGTEYGGVVDQASYEAGREATGSILCKGRTWHGILAGKRLLPDSGSGYLSVSGKAGEVLASLIERMGLSGHFSAASDDTAIKYTFDRFTDGYSGLKAMAKANGRKVAMRRKGGKVEISLPPAVDYANKVDSDLLDFTLTSVHRCVNHLVCAGTGELENRAVVHFYADAAGNVSHTQSLFGVDEIAALYDYSNADEAQLEEEGRKKLQEYQTQGSVEVEAHDDIDVDVGDVISARDNAHGRTVTATVAKKIVKVSRGVATYSYEVGSETTTKTSSSGNAEGNGGHAYLAGKGLTLEGGGRPRERQRGGGGRRLPRNRREGRPPRDGWRGVLHAGRREQLVLIERNAEWQTETSQPTCRTTRRARRRPGACSARTPGARWPCRRGATSRRASA